MMHAMIGLVQQGVGKDAAEAVSRDDAASRAVYGVTEQTEMFDVLAPGLEICRNQGRGQVNPEKIFPHVPKSDRCHNNLPPGHREGQLHPSSPSHLPASDLGVRVDENAEENERRIKKAEG